MPSVHDDVLDGAHNIVKNNCDKMVACSATPTTYTEANATYALADVAMSSTDFTIANGDVSGRKITTGAKSGALIDASGTATCVAKLDTVNSKLLEVVDLSASQPLTANGSNTVNFPAHKREIRDPS